MTQQKCKIERMWVVMGIFVARLILSIRCGGALDLIRKDRERVSSFSVFTTCCANAVLIFKLSTLI